MIKRLLVAFSVFGVCLMAITAPVGAKDIYSGVDCGGEAKNSTICKEKANAKEDPLSGRDGEGLLIKITNIVAYVGGAAAIIMIIYGAIRFAISGSDISTGARQDTDVEKARDTIFQAVVGLIIIVMAKTLIVFVLKEFGG